MILSILIPTYNRKTQLLIALKSCLDYHDRNIEIIIGDDSEASLENDFFKQVSLPSNYTIKYLHRPISLKQNKNVASLINEASGTYSLILHDDDYLLPNSLQILIKAAESRNDLNCIYFGKQILVNDSGELIEPNNLNRDYFRSEEFKGLQSDPVKMALLQQVPSNSFLFPTEYAKKIGYRNYETVGDACDFDFIIRFVLKEKTELFFINKDISAYRLSPHSISQSAQNNAIFFKYEVMKDLKIANSNSEILRTIIKSDLNVLCGYYISNNYRNELRKIYFSGNYPVLKRFTLRGIYHLLNCFIR
ncbi:glycosyltransferase family 2 protein [Pedobacter arcticus]|uniref:glycosyltransferase family 2 protein n=1 Tax=Pedobacter arcticus TaxID=752140 RepID=UPI0002FA702F|nr:glycosyltransferase [Pedobacter arcticus]